MDLVFLLKGIIIGFIASIPLGPVGVLTVQRTLNKGRLSGVFSGMGAAVVDTLYAIIAVMGLSYVIHFIEEQQIYFQLIGGIVLIALGMRIFYTNPVRQLRRQMRKKNNIIEDFFSVVLLTLSNPLAIFLFIAGFAGIGVMTTSLNNLMSFLIIGGVFIGALLWWAFLSYVVDLFRKHFRLKQMWWINKIAGMAIFVFGFLAMFKVVLGFLNIS